MTISQRIFALLREKKLSQKELSEYTGGRQTAKYTKSGNTVYKYENGRQTARFTNVNDIMDCID